MKNRNRILRPIATAAVAAIALTTGCERAPDAEPQTENQPMPQAQVSGLFAATPPAEPSSILELRQNPETGRTVTVQGVIAGTAKPFSEEYAMFVFADETLQTCDKIPGDTCSTPWDACCADPESIKASRVTIQIPGPDGTPLPGTLEGVHELGEMDRLVIDGTVADNSTADSIIINATRIYPLPDKETPTESQKSPAANPEG